MATKYIFGYKDKMKTGQTLVFLRLHEDCLFLYIFILLSLRSVFHSLIKFISRGLLDCCAMNCDRCLDIYFTKLTFYFSIPKGNLWVHQNSAIGGVKREFWPKFIPDVTLINTYFKARMSRIWLADFLRQKKKIKNQEKTWNFFIPLQKKWPIHSFFKIIALPIHLTFSTSRKTGTMLTLTNLVTCVSRFMLTLTEQTQRVILLPDLRNNRKVLQANPKHRTWIDDPHAFFIKRSCSKARMARFPHVHPVACLVFRGLLDVPSGDGVDFGRNFWNQSNIFTRLYSQKHLFVRSDSTSIVYPDLRSQQRLRPLLALRKRRPVRRQYTHCGLTKLEPLIPARASLPAGCSAHPTRTTSQEGAELDSHQEPRVLLPAACDAYPHTHRRLQTKCLSVCAIVFSFFYFFKIHVSISMRCHRRLDVTELTSCSPQLCVKLAIPPATNKSKKTEKWRGSRSCSLAVKKITTRKTICFMRVSRLDLIPVHIGTLNTAFNPSKIILMKLFDFFLLIFLGEYFNYIIKVSLNPVKLPFRCSPEVKKSIFILIHDTMF
ncbi:hypothetical protein VP01_2728g1 [Puccinia sorghi]|uniref:Uncharacterized protein n=1 Tax=Puccinia sorghi TaxID=27349 RepID=A0A0L6V3Z2_9BASI|nr:hypothetical protein VP01_2728g1 [Puccinia sorghi]